MKLILKEKKKVEEVKTGKYGDVFVTMSPRTFLQLTLPNDDYYLVERFLNEAQSIKDPQQILQLAKNLEKETDSEMMQIGKDVMFRGAFFLNKNGPFKPEMAGRLSLAVQMKGRTPVVTSHGGRARSVIAALSGVKEIEASILFYDMTVDQFISDPSIKQIMSQDFREGGTQLVPKDLIHVQDS
jgi:hypothetical protein